MTFNAYSKEDDYAALEELRKAHPLLVDLQTPEGRRWKRRMDDSEAYFKRYSRDWEENRLLLCHFENMVGTFGTYVAIAPSILANFIADMYFRNPDPLIQDKGGDKDLSRIMTDVLRSIHAENDTEGRMRHAFHDQWWAGFGGIVGSFLQKPANAGESIAEESAEGESQDTGEMVEPTDQKVVLRRISPWKCRFDPKGREWDMSDHRYFAYDDVAYLGPLMRDPTLSEEDKARLMAYYSTGAAAFSVEGGEEPEGATGYRETDPEFIRVSMRTIWSRPDHMVYRQPFGASFTFTPRPWDEEWERADDFPFHYMPAPNRVPEDKANTEGFIGVPYLTLIGQHVKNINKAQGLLMGALEHVIDVYVTMQGLLNGMKMEEVTEAGRRFKVIGIDPKEFEKYPSQQDKPVSMKDALYLLPSGDTEDLQHMKTIVQEFNFIAQILGQGPAERGGVSESDTATESLGIQQGLSRRMSSTRNEAGKHYNAVTAMAFKIIQARHTLPLKYQMTTQFDQKVWYTFVDPRGTLKDVDLHFEYATGSTEPRTREQQFALVERMATILMPILQAQQDTRSMMQVAQMLIEPLNIIGSDQFFNDQLSQLVMQLLTIYRALALPPGSPNSVTADNAQVMQQIPELFMQIAQIVLTPSQLAQVESAVRGAPMPESASTNTGSIEKAPSPGEASAAAGAAGSAAAGAKGGIQFSEALPAPALQNTPV